MSEVLSLPFALFAMTVPDSGPRLVIPARLVSAPESGDGLSDSELVERCKAGERGAFDHLYLRHADRIYRSLARIVGASEAEDLTQQSFLEAFRSLHRFRGDSAFSTWLYRISVNTAMHALRRSKRRSESSVAIEDSNGVQLVDPSISPAQRTEEQELWAQVSQCLHSLKPKQRIALVLRYSEELSLEEISQVVGDKSDTIGKRIKKAEQEMSRMLGSINRMEEWR